MPIKRLWKGMLGLAMVASLAMPACAQTETFDVYLDEVARKAEGEGVSQATVDRMLRNLSPNDRVMVLDRDNAPSGSGGSSSFPPMAPYIERHNTQARISGGQRTYARLRSLDTQVEGQYGVPPEIVIAIWGHETAYGAVQGSFDLTQALATLAWEGRRRDLFERELIDLLKIADSGVANHSLTGSWAGAFGNPQFLPSVYLRLAVDGDGNGDKNIWSSDADTMHSIANYFRDAGWRAGQPWGVRAFVPNSVNRAAIGSALVSPVCPRVHVRHSRWLSVREWREMGVIPQAPIADDVLAALFEPDGAAAPGYLLTQNYRVILEYNCSNYYAMSVGLLADRIAN